jgi:signal transduction histidine kinase
MSADPGVRRATAARTARTAGQAIRAAVRPQATAWTPPWVRRRWLVRLVPVVAGLYAIIVAISASGAVLDGRYGTNGGIAFLLLLPAVVGVAAAPVRPLDGWLVVTGWLFVLRYLLPGPLHTVLVHEIWGWLFWVPSLLFAAWAARGRVALGVPLVSALALLASAVLTPWPVELHAITPALVLTAVPLALGSALGLRQSARTAVRQQQARADDALARQGALAERARIAREMHDVVAHSMSMIAVRAETAPYRLGELPDDVRTEFAEVAAAARQSLGEMQNLLGVLRADDAGERAPQPGLPDLEELLQRTRAAGADLSWELETPDVPPALGLTAYRIVQQGLANAAEHAPGAPVRVRVLPDGGALRIAVVNGAGAAGRGTARPDGPGDGRGAGVPGMRERAAVHGGEVIAGPTPDGGFALSATLPLPEAAS